MRTMYGGKEGLAEAVETGELKQVKKDGKDWYVFCDYESGKSSGFKGSQDIHMNMYICIRT